MSENREVRSDVFSMLMEEKEYALEVYNTLSGKHYSDPELVEVVTLEKGISLSIRNDAAIIVDMNLHIYEHQSTYNPNMPARCLIYLGDIMKPILSKQNLYGSKIVKIPTPKFVVFYNGITKRPSKEILRLSDAFYNQTDDPELELKCTVYNINSEDCENMIRECHILAEYTSFVEKIRYNEKKGSSAPIKEAIDWCIKNDVLSDFLKKRGQEVIKAMTIDMTFERREPMIREEGLYEGRILACQENITEFLKEYGEISGELSSAIEEEQNLDILKKWVKLAAKVTSVEEFASKMYL